MKGRLGEARPGRYARHREEGEPLSAVLALGLDPAMRTPVRYKMRDVDPQAPEPEAIHPPMTASCASMSSKDSLGDGLARKLAERAATVAGSNLTARRIGEPETTRVSLWLPAP